MNAVGESATGGVDGPDGTGRPVAPAVGWVGIPPEAPGLLGAALCPPAVAGGGVGAAPAGRVDEALGQEGRVGALPGAAGRTEAWFIGVCGRPGVTGGGGFAPPCGLGRCAVLPGQGGGASTPGRPGVRAGSGRPVVGRPRWSVVGVRPGGGTAGRASRGGSAARGGSEVRGASAARFGSTARFGSAARGASAARGGSEARGASAARGGSAAREGSGVVGGRDAAGRAGNTGSGQLPAGVGRGAGSGRSTLGRKSVGSSV